MGNIHKKEIKEKCRTVNKNVVIIIVALTGIIFLSSLNNIPRKAISSNKAGTKPIEIIHNKSGKGEFL